MVAATMEVKGQRFVILPEAEYERLLSRGRGGDADLPPLPNGNFDAVAYARASLARKLIRDRRAAGLSQAELARRAGMRVETLNRIERMKMTPSVAAVGRLDRAMAASTR
ncbi:MAG TPA: helix-turn-helix transcriptional regulator [Tepidisphaeraceae bacterium]|nr:helix-turn-helix transcriptional regulator [Tepidisphaeraceae bacterium]